MFDIGWSELLLIGVVALIVIGPEDLPKLFQTLGRLTAKARGMAREFTSAMEDAAKSSGLDEASKTLRDVNSLTSKRALGIDALERATERFEKWDPLNPRDAAGAARPVPGPAAPAPSAAPPKAPTTATPAVMNGTPAPAGPAAKAHEPAPASGGRRRLHGVRRTDQGN